VTGPGPGGLAYTYGTVAGLSLSIAGFVTGMQTELDQLDAVFTALLRDDWNGHAAEAFRTCSTTWHTAATALAQRIAVLAERVERSGTDMEQTDGVVANRLA